MLIPKNKGKKLTAHSFESNGTAHRIKKWILFYGEYQKEFGRRFNIEQSYLSTILCPKRKLPGTVLRSMVQQGGNLKWLFTGEGEMLLSAFGESSPPSTDNHISREMAQLKDEWILSLQAQVQRLTKQVESLPSEGVIHRV